MSENSRTRRTGRWGSRTVSISAAVSVVSTWAKTPRTVSVLAAMTVVLHGRGNRLLHLDDRHRWHQLDEAEEEDEEPGETADDDRRVGRRRDVDPPRVRVEVVAEGWHDDVEALEPHADEHENGDDVE